MRDCAHGSFWSGPNHAFLPGLAFWGWGVGGLEGYLRTDTILVVETLV